MYNKSSFKEKMTIMGGFVKQYFIAYILMLLLVAVFEIVFIIYWFFTIKTYSTRNFIYLFSYIGLLVVSLIAIYFLILLKRNNFSLYSMAIFLHIYSALIMVWSTIITILDLKNNASPIVHITVTMVLGGIIVISPIFYTIINLSSIIIIAVFNYINNYNYFDGPAAYMNIVIFIIMTIIMAFRHYTIRINEAKTNNYLRKISYTDHLTGLGNETSYFESVDKLMNVLDRVKLKYGIVVMDVNNVKTTNDTYGHRFGCHLIVEAGHMLPSIFKTSRLFHVGGDEFIVILLGEDYDNLENVIKDFDSKLRYSKIEYEGHELIFSVARGYCLSKEGMSYKEVFQAADDKMYENKKEIKKQYNLIIREK